MSFRLKSTSINPLFVEREMYVKDYHFNFLQIKNFNSLFLSKINIFNSNRSLNLLNKIE